jgi:hypothetical protein
MTLDPNILYQEHIPREEKNTLFKRSVSLVKHVINMRCLEGATANLGEISSAHLGAQLSLALVGYELTGLSPSHIATDGLSVSKSWCRAPSGTHDQIFITVEYYGFVFLWVALSDERTDLSFIHANGSCQRSLSRVRVPWYS